MQESPPIDYADSKIRRYFLIILLWIADYRENVSLHGIKSKACPKCEGPPQELESWSGHHCPRDYAGYKYYEHKNISLDSETHDAAHAPYPNETHGIKSAQKTFQELVRVLTPDLHKPHMLHTTYLGHFKHMRDRIQGFLKKNAWQQAFNDAWKGLPPCLVFFVTKKANREVKLWQEK